MSSTGETDEHHNPFHPGDYQGDHREGVAEMTKIVQMLRHFLCPHLAELPVLEKDRIYLKCYNCGRETVGWRIGKCQTP